MGSGPREAITSDMRRFTTRSWWALSLIFFSVRCSSSPKSPRVAAPSPPVEITLPAGAEQRIKTSRRLDASLRQALAEFPQLGITRLGAAAGVSASDGSGVRYVRPRLQDPGWPLKVAREAAANLRQGP
jgi:hypothetical protein